MFPAPPTIRLDKSMYMPCSENQGVEMSVDGLFNLPETGVMKSSPLYKVVASLYPPGLFYEYPPLTGGVHFTVNMDLESKERAPLFHDSFWTFTPTSSFSSNSVIVLDVRTIEISKSKEKKRGRGSGGRNNEEKDGIGSIMDISIQDPSSERKSFWMIFPVTKLDGEYVNSGSFQLPLIQGEVDRDVLNSPNPYQELMRRVSQRKNSPTCLKLANGSSIFIRLRNPLLSSYLDIQSFDEKFEGVDCDVLREVVSCQNEVKRGKFDYSPFKFDDTKTWLGGIMKPLIKDKKYWEMVEKQKKSSSNALSSDSSSSSSSGQGGNDELEKGKKIMKEINKKFAQSIGVNHYAF